MEGVIAAPLLFLLSLQLLHTLHAMPCPAAVTDCAAAAAVGPAAVVEREPTITGKPSPFLLSDIIARHNCVPQKMIMVGDRLDTDILWGRNTGMATLLVLTGGRRHRMCLWAVFDSATAWHGMA